MKATTRAQTPSALDKGMPDDTRAYLGKNPKSKLIIEPKPGWAALDLRALWQYRELFYFLTWRDIKVRYKQTVIGAGWAVLQPFLTMIVFSVVFGRFVGVSSEGVPYPVFSFSGLLPWTLFAVALSHSGTSLVSNSQLVSKVYFPRLILPMAAVLPATVDFAIAFMVLLGMMAWYGIVPSASIVLLPVFVLLALVTALGAGIWMTALDVRYRDIRYLIPFITQFWLFVTPVAYPSSYVPEQWRWLYALNPMVGVIEGFRWALLGQAFESNGMIYISAVVSIILLVSGLYYFRNTERHFADLM